MSSFYFQVHGLQFELRQHLDNNGFALLCHNLGQNHQIMEFDLYHLRPERTETQPNLHFQVLVFDAIHQVDLPTALLTFTKDDGLRIIPGDIAMPTPGHDGRINFVTDPQFFIADDEP